MGSRKKRANIPEHIIFWEILPLLSFDVLEKLKCVCKSWCSFISSNPMLPLDRFRHRVSSNLGVVFSHCSSDGQLLLLPTLRGDPLGIPNILSVNFSQQSSMEILASTNGLLCLKCNYNNIYVCNPLTNEGQIIPLSNYSLHNTPRVDLWRSSIGLAYDPSKSSAQYKLVCPWSASERGSVVFGFEVFSSQTNKWDKSCNKYYAKRNSICMMKSTYAGGVLYWNCTYCLIYFDPEKNDGGTVTLPYDPLDGARDRHKIGEFEGNLTCSSVSRKGMRLWIMDVNRRGYWEPMHWVSFETVIETNQYVFRSAFCLDIPPRNREDLNILFKRFNVLALPYGGGERLFMRVHLWGEQQEKVLCYEMKSGKLMEFCTLCSATDGLIRNSGSSFLYRSSMVSLPRLGKASFDKEP